jgi:hypothetical protein
MTVYSVANTITRDDSGPIAGATVTVYTLAGTLATIYRDAGGTSVIANSRLTTGSDGRADYWAAAGMYFQKEVTPDNGTAYQPVFPGLFSTPGGGSGSGTVTSVDLSMPTGFTVGNVPITSSGTITVELTDGYTMVTQAQAANWDSVYSQVNSNSANWTTAYNERAQWDGGATNLVAATGRASLGATTAGEALFTLPNPSAITFLRINADNTVSALDAATFRVAIGAGTSNFDGTYASLTGKPTLGTAAALNVPAAGNAASGEVVKGSDSRLSDTRTPTDNTVTFAKFTTATKTFTVEFLIDSGSSIIAAGAYPKTYASPPRAGTIVSWTLVATDNTTTSAVVDVLKNGGSITASAKPTLSSATTATSSTLTGWTTSFVAGDVFTISVTSNTAATGLKLILTYTAT